VVQLASVRTPQEKIAKVLNVATMTLLTHYAREIELGYTLLRKKVIGTLVANLEDDDPNVRQRAADSLASRVVGLSDTSRSVNLHANAHVDLDEFTDASMLDAMAAAFDNLPAQPKPQPLAALPAPAPVVPIREVHRHEPTGSPDGHTIEGEARQVPDSDVPPRGKLPRQRSALDVAADVNVEEARIDAGIPSATRGGRFPGDL